MGLLCRCLFIAACAAASASPACGQSAAGSSAAAGGGYSLHPPVLSAPAGAPGAVRRSIMQFYHWTLLCDEYIAEKKQICNVTQAVWNAAGETVFSWSLAASDSGAPFMVLRAPPNADSQMPIHLAVRSGGAADIPFIGCDKSVCLAQTPIGPILAAAIKNQAEVSLSYALRGGALIRFSAPLLGVREAVASIR